MKTVLYLLAIICLFSSHQNISGQKSTPLPITDDTPQSAIVVDSTHIMKVFEEINKNNQQVLEATIPLKKSNKKIAASVNELEKYVGQKDSKPAAKKRKVVQPILTDTVVVEKPKTFWQKVKEIFKSKPKNNGADKKEKK